MRRESLTRGDDLALEVASGAPRPVLLPRRRAPHPLDRLLTSRGLDDAIVCTLNDEDRVFGLMLVGDRVGDVSTFADEDLGLCETFAGHASVLLENGRLERSLAQVTELTEELHHQAYTDALTQLPNRLLFAERLGETLEGGDRRTHAVLFLDLDRFKVVNDSWGHAAGDELLVQVAERIQGAVRPQDTPARLGGDEFAVLDARHGCRRRDPRGTERLIDRHQRPDLAVLRPPGDRARERRRRRHRPRRLDPRGAASQRRPRDVHGKDRGARLRALRARAAPPHPRSPIARPGARAGRGARRVRRVLTSRWSRWSTARSRPSRRWPAGSTPSAGCSSRPSS